MRVLPYRTSSAQVVVRDSGGRGFRVTRLGGFANRALIVACLLLLNCTAGGVSREGLRHRPDWTFERRAATKSDAKRDNRRR
jgi:hypothetical protein